MTLFYLLLNWDCVCGFSSHYYSTIIILHVCKYMYICVCMYLYMHMGFPGGSEVKASAWNAGDLGSIPGLGRSSGEGNGNPLQYSCLENPMEGGGWWGTVHGVAKSRTRLSDFTFTFQCTAQEISHNGALFKRRQP